MPAAEPRSPEQFLGFRPGSDRQLADWTQIVAYFRDLAGASERLRVEEVGRSAAGLPFLRVTITSPANLARLEELRRVNLRLWDPRGLSADEAARLLATGKTIVALQHGIHATEAASTQTALETAYRLATSEAPDVLEILDQTIVVMLPSQNPDGTQELAEWYRRTLGTPYEGRGPPFLSQRYTGHDNNRDWYMFTQAESRLTLRHVYDHWRPQIVHDLHQMGAKGARLFVPPYLDPWEPNVDPALRAAVNALGMHVAARLTSAGRAGVVTQALFDAWTPARAYPHTHGGVRFLSEAAGTRLASPEQVAPQDLGPGLGYDASRASWNFPLPWAGGAWRLQDAVDYQLDATFALLEHAARQRSFWLANFLAVNRRAATRCAPFAFVLPAEQHDAWAAARLVEVLRLGGVEVRRARERFEADGRVFAAGAQVVSMAQPGSAFAKSLLERQQYPDLRPQPGGLPLRPYDVTAHTLSLLMGVSALPIEGRFEVPLDDLNAPALRPGRAEGRGGFLAFGHRTGQLVALARLLSAGVPVHWALEPFSSAGRSYPAGTLYAPASARRRLSELTRELGFEARGVQARPVGLRLRLPRVGVYQSWVPASDEGWTRFVLERELGLVPRTLHDRDVQSGALRGRFDAIVLADQPRSELLAGHALGEMPEEYTGGLGASGVARLREFVQQGGTLIALNRACELAVSELGLPVRDALAGLERGEFFGPGAILRVKLDAQQPLTHGLAESLPIWFENGPAYEALGNAPRLLARYEEPDPLLSGWLLGGKRLQARAAWVDVPLGRGRVVLFGFRPQYRAQSWASYVALANALYLSAAEGGSGAAAGRPSTRESPSLPDGGLGAQPRSGVSPQGPSVGIHSRREPPDGGFGGAATKWREPPRPERWDSLPARAARHREG